MEHVDSVGSSSVIVTVLFVTSVVVAGPVEQIPHEAAAGQQGGAVLFFASYQGQLRDVLYNPIVFNQVLVNQGSAYNNMTGKFTAPLAGIYQFVFAAQLCRGNHNNVWDFMVNGNTTMACHAQLSGGDTTLNTCYNVEKLKTGDQVWVKQNAGSCAWASSTSRTITFSGMLLAGEGVPMLGGKRGSGSSCPLFGLGAKEKTASSSAGRSITVPLSAVTLWLCWLLLD